MVLNILFISLIVHSQQHKGFIGRLMINAGISIFVAPDAILYITYHMKAHEKHFTYIVKINYDHKSLLPLCVDIIRKLLLKYLLTCNHFTRK